MRIRTGSLALLMAVAVCAATKVAHAEQVEQVEQPPVSQPAASVVNVPAITLHYIAVAPAGAELSLRVPVAARDSMQASVADSSARVTIDTVASAMFRTRRDTAADVIANHAAHRTSRITPRIASYRMRSAGVANTVQLVLRSRE